MAQATRVQGSSFARLLARPIACLVMSSSFATVLATHISGPPMLFDRGVQALVFGLRYRAHMSGSNDEMNSILDMNLWEDDDGTMRNCDTADNADPEYSEFCNALASVTGHTRRLQYLSGSARPFATVLQNMVDGAGAQVVNWAQLGQRIINRLQYRAYRTGNWGGITDALQTELFEDEFGTKYSCDSAGADADIEFMDFCAAIASVQTPRLRRLQTRRLQVMPFTTLLQQFATPNLPAARMNKLLRLVRYRVYRFGDFSELDRLWSADIGGQTCNGDSNSADFDDFCSEIAAMTSMSVRLL